MYHEITYAELARRRRDRIVLAVVAVVFAVLLVFTALAAQAIGRMQGAESERETIVNAAMQCCAIEGSYPSSLSHLEERYGVVVNHRDYVVNYEWLGDNVVPSVVVTLR